MMSEEVMEPMTATELAYRELEAQKWERRSLERLWLPVIDALLKRMKDLLE